MDPLSHATHNSPVAPEQAGNGVRTQIGDVPNDVLVANIFSYLGSKDLSHTDQVCRRFNVLGRTTWQIRAQELCQACSKSLASFGITPLCPNPSQEEAAIFLRETTLRVKEINQSFPENLHSPFSTGDLVCKVGLGHVQEFLQKAYDHSLRTVFGELAHVPKNASLDDAARLIREWLSTAEAEQVQELDLEHRGLCCLPKEIGQLTALQTLVLGNNRLGSLPPEIGQLTALQTLVLGNNRLTSLPPEIGQPTVLQWLSLSNNWLGSLPPEIGRLTALDWLALDDNHITSLPPEIWRLTALQELGLSSNRLASIQPEIGRLTALQTLCLDGNQLESLPREIDQLAALQELFLEGNRFTTRPEAIGRLKA